MKVACTMAGCEVVKPGHRVTHTRRVRSQFDADEKSVLFFTGMTLAELWDYKMDMGREWLMKYCMRNGMGKEVAEVLWQEPILLQWWNLEWRKMDRFTILPMLHLIVPEKCADMYKEMHLDVFHSSHPDYDLMEIAIKKRLERINEQESQQL